jgi:hypothetical protein
MKYSIFIMTVVLFLFFAPLVLAGSISITVTATSSGFENNNMINLSLQNSGNEAAEDVHISLLLPQGFTSENAVIGRLVPGVPWSGSIIVNTTDNLLPGAYPAVILTQYRDANGYPFSSVSKSNIIYKEISYSDISGMIKKAELSDNGNIDMTLRNLGSSAIDAKIRLYLPLEIKADEYEKSIHLDAKSEKELSFRVSNFGALAGSSYFVLAAVEYDGDKHYTQFASGIVEIKEKTGIIGIDNNWLIIIIIVLAAIFIIYQLRGRIKWGKKSH